MKDDKPYVTIASFQHPNEAAVQLSVLESHGIEADLLDDHTASMNPIMGMYNGGVKLIVAREDEHEAVLVLTGKPPEESRVEFDHADIVRANLEGVCPGCDSKAVADPRRSALFGAVVLGLFGGAIGIELPSGVYGALGIAAVGIVCAYVLLRRLNPYWRCRACGAIWEARK